MICKSCGRDILVNTDKCPRCKSKHNGHDVEEINAGDIVNFGKYYSNRIDKLTDVEWIVVSTAENSFRLISRYVVDVVSCTDSHAYCSNNIINTKILKIIDNLLKFNGTDELVDIVADTESYLPTRNDVDLLQNHQKSVLPTLYAQIKGASLTTGGCESYLINDEYNSYTMFNIEGKFREFKWVKNRNYCVRLAIIINKDKFLTLNEDYLFNSKKSQTSQINTICNEHPCFDNNLQNNIKIGSSINFGCWPQDIYSGYQPIQWKILDIVNNNALLISDKILCQITYQADHGPVSYEESSNIRWWLTNSFYFNAFNEVEKERIIKPSSIFGKSSNNSDWTGNFIDDYVYILNKHQAESYFSGADSRTALLSDRDILDRYAIDGEAWGDWWLRSEDCSALADLVSSNGEIINFGCINSAAGIRPTIWIRLGIEGL